MWISRQVEPPHSSQSRRATFGFRYSDSLLGRLSPSSTRSDKEPAEHHSLLAKHVCYHQVCLTELTHLSALDIDAYSLAQIFELDSGRQRISKRIGLRSIIVMDCLSAPLWHTMDLRYRVVSKSLTAFNSALLTENPLYPFLAPRYLISGIIVLSTYNRLCFIGCQIISSSCAI